MHFEEIGQCNSVDVSSAPRMMFYEVSIVFDVFNFTTDITCYVEQCVRRVPRCETGKFGVELVLFSVVVVDAL